jgi:hypothetical protein
MNKQKLFVVFTLINNKSLEIILIQFLIPIVQYQLLYYLIYDCDVMLIPYKKE